MKKFISILSLLVAFFDFYMEFMPFINQKMNPDRLYIILIDFNSYITIWISLLILMGLCLYYLIKTKTSLYLFIITCIIGFIGCYILGAIDILLFIALLLYSFLFIRIKV